MRSKPRNRDPRRQISVQRAVVLWFAGAILLGAVLLALPVCSASGEWTRPLDALFTAVSAVCVTGLVVVDTGSHFSGLGQVVVALLIQAGGLGIMTLGTIVLLAVGRRPSFSSEVVLTDTYGRRHGNGLLVVLKYAVLMTLSCEFVGMLVLYHVLSSPPHGMALSAALGSAAFHSISAFCNAGFSLYADSLAGFREEPAVLLVVSVLIVFGGIGFPVMFNLSQLALSRRVRGRGRVRLSLQAKLMLWGTLALLVIGAVGMLGLEWGGAFDGLPTGQRVSGAVFESITPRTAGFSTIDYGTVRPATLWLVSGLMLIGGGPGGTAGGAKVTTMMVLLLTGVAILRGRSTVTAFGRTVPDMAIWKAIIVLLSMLLMVFGIGLVVMAVEGTSCASGGQGATARLLFETVSALGTVGLSTGVTANLSTWAKLALIVAMFVGRLGPLTVALVVGRRETSARIRYPEEPVMIG